MKQNIVRVLSCVLLVAAAVAMGNATISSDIRYENHTLCEGGTFHFGNLSIKSDTTWSDTVPGSIPTADSIVTIYSVRVIRPKSLSETRELEVGSTMLWHGQVIDGPGEYMKVYKSKSGCDSMTYYLTVRPRFVSAYFYSELDTTICYGGHVDWRGQTPSIASTYVDTARAATIFDRDTLYVLYLHVQKPVYKTEVVEFASFPATYRGETFAAANDEHDITLVSSKGCDSVVYHVIARQQMISNHTYASICQGKEYLWDVNSKTYTEGGTYYSYVKSKADPTRDSIENVLHLTAHPNPTTYLYRDICEGGFVQIGDQKYSTAGIHTKKFTTVHGCDSTVVLSLTVHYPTTQDTVAHIEQGGSVTWNGQTYSAEGTYTKPLVDRFGCDSIVRLVLTTHRVDTMDTAVVLCPNTSITWHGITASSTGTIQRYENIDASLDRLYRLSVVAKQLQIKEDTFQLCDNNSVRVMGETYTEAGTYDHQYTCDTLYRITVLKPRQDTLEFFDTFNGASAYTWNFHHEGVAQSFSIDAAGTHTKRLDNSSGCKNTYILHLTVDSLTYNFYDSTTVCEGQNFEWQGYTTLSSQHVGETWEYTKSYKTYTDKDSTYHLKLTVLPKQRVDIGTVWFNSFPTSYLGQSIPAPGRYTATLTTVAGCDSIVSFAAQRQTVKDSVSVSICDGSSHSWQGHTYSYAGIYYETERAQDGSDSIYHILNLSVTPKAHKVLYENICQGGSTTFGGQILTESGVYYDTILSPRGCDSILELHLNVNPVRTYVHEFTRPEGDTVMWGGRELKSPTVYDTIVRNAVGCDSIIRIVVHATRMDTVNEEATICQGEYKEWLGERYYTSGTYGKIDTLSNNQVVYAQLKLVVTGTTKFGRNKPVTICQGESYAYFDSVYTSAGTYLYPYSCDTVDTVAITVIPAVTHIKHETFNGTDPYVWSKRDNGSANDTTISDAGTYEHRIKSSSSDCYEIYRLHLSVDSASYHYEETQSKCYGEPLVWHNQDLTYLPVGTHDRYDNWTSKSGKDSTYHLLLTVYAPYEKTERIEFVKFPATYRGLHFDAPGTKTLTLQSVNGCDSIITVIANLRTLVEEESATICSGDYYDWHNNRYSATGDYTIRDASLSGDTVEYTLHLNVLNIPETRLNVTICHGGSYTLGTESYTQSGVYHKTFVHNGCDSTVVLSLNVLDASRSVTYRTIQEGDNFTWNGKPYDTEGVYQFDTTNAMGCDSVAILHLSFIKTDTVERTVTICPDSSYTWNGHTFDVSGDHEWIEAKEDGNLVRYILHLTVREQVMKDLHFTICSGESITLNGKTYTSDTTFNQAQTCDTVYRVVIRRLPSMVHNYEFSFDGTSYHWLNTEAGIDTVLTEAGTYYKYRHNNTTGCNDTHRLILTEIKPNEQTYSFDEYKTVCQGEDFEWQGESRKEWSLSGIGKTTHYYEKYTTVYGKDSTYHLALTVRPVPQATQTFPFCDSIVWNGQTIKESKQITDTFKTSFGCDSLVTTYFVKGTAFHHYATDSVALGETLEWHGLTITNEGTYNDTHLSTLGCDSSYTLIVTLKHEIPQTKTRTFRHTMCEGDVYTWGKSNKNYHETGTYYDTVFVGSTTEIDSIHILHLTVNPTYSLSEHIAFPRSQFPLYYRNHRFTKPDTAQIHYLSSQGCDSLITVYVNYQTATYRETATICAGDSFPWHDQLYREAGIYNYQLKSSDGQYDSVTYILDLKVKYIPVTRVDTTICSGNSILFGGRNLNESGSYTHTFKNEGCDSTVVLTLHVDEAKGTTEVHRMNPGEPPYSWKDSTYSTTGIYYHHSTNGLGCQITDMLILTVNRVDTVDTIATACPNALPFKWHGIEASSSGLYTGVDSTTFDNWQYYRLHLTVRPQKTIDTTLTICPGETVSFNGREYSETGRYEDSYNNCDTIYNIYVRKTPNQVHIEKGSLNDTEDGYKWSFWRDGRYVKDSVFTEVGTYEYTSPDSVTGCKDVWRLILTKDENEYKFEQSLEICEGDVIVWQGQVRDDLGYSIGDNTYEAKYKTRAGQDSIYILHLTVKEAVRTESTINFCGSHTWNGVVYTATTDVYDTLTAANGCDSIVHVTLRKMQPFFEHDTATIMQGEILNWHNIDISTNGLYRDPHLNQYGCDSTYEIGVGVIPAPVQDPLYTTQASICNGDSVEWRGHYYITPGTYIDTIYTTPAKEKIDSICVLNLRVWPSYTDSTLNVRHLYACGEGSSIKYDGNDYTRDTVFTKVFQSVHGCDSIEQVVMHFSDGLSSSESKRITDKELPYRWNVEGQDTLITSAGTFHKTVRTSGRCDLDYELVLTVDQTFTRTLDTTACADNLPFYWVIGNDTIGEGRSHAIGDTVTYITRYDRADPLNRADSMYVLTLTLIQPFDTAIIVHGCQNQGASYRDELYYRDTTFIDRVEVVPSSPSQPCDSIFRVTIKMDTVYHITIDTTLCEYQLPLIIGRVNPDTIWWEGNFQHASDLTACGCDSIIEGSLKIIPKLERNDSTFVCEDYFFSGNSVTLGDTVNPAFLANDGGKWAGKWEGKWTGVHYTTDTIVTDCDSNYTHHIIVRPSQKVPRDTTVYLCDGDSAQLFWPKDIWVKKDTIYYDTVTTNSKWTDPVHNYTYLDSRSTCDSITRWTVKIIKPEHVDTTAHILLGDSLDWHGIYRYFTGTYYDTVPTKYHTEGNDSITCLKTFTLNLIADSSYLYQKAIDTCVIKNTIMQYTWEDGHVQTFKVDAKDTIARVYYDSLITQSTPYPRDSIYELSVTYHIIRDTLIFDTICPGDSVAFDRHWFNANNNTTQQQYLKDPGVYRDTVTAVNGCDSIITLHLALFDRIPVTHQTVHIADTARPYLWKHKWGDMTTDSIMYLNASGDYECYMKSVHGCDSIDSLTLVFHKTYNIWEDSITICQSETPYEWEDRTDITTSGKYTFHTLTKEGYDSIRNVNIKVLPVVYDTIRRSICSGDSIVFGLKHDGTENYLKLDGSYTDTLVSTRYGCDSIVTLYLNVHTKYLKHYDVDIADVDTPYLWPHQWFDGIQMRQDTDTILATGKYSFVMPSIHGCDSIDSLSLRIHKTYIFRDTVTICSSETPYTWYNADSTEIFKNDIYVTDTYYKHLQTHDNYDSTYIRFVQVLPIRTVTIHDSICAGDNNFYNFNGLKLTESGVYTYTTTAHNGCDSIVTLHLSVNHPYYSFREEHIVEGTPYNYNGQNIYRDTTIVQKGFTPNGCDSTMELKIVVHPLVDTVVTVCSPELPYIWTNKWNGQVTPLYAAGLYRNDTTFVNGVRMYYGLKLVVNNPTDSTIYKTVCEGTTYRFNGQDLKISGEYRDTLVNANGCDSTVILHLNFAEQSYHTIERSIFQGDTVHFYGETYSTTGNYPVRFTTANGCDSIVELILTVNKLFDDSISICYNELPLTWNNKTINQSGIYRDTVVNSLGKQTITGLKVNVLPIKRSEQPILDTICEGDSYEFGSRRLTTGGTYEDTLTATNGCDSIRSLVLQVMPVKNEVKRRTIFEGDSVIFFGETYRESGIYYHTEKNENKCTDTYQLILNVVKSFRKDTTAYICENDLPFLWRGKEYWASCVDSVPTWTDTTRLTTTLHLTVNPVFQGTRNISICQNDTFRYAKLDTVFTQSGEFYDTIPSAVGCDSIIRYIVSVHPTYDNTITRTISDQQSYNFHGRILKNAGTYKWDSTSMHGCDSTEHLVLNVQPSYHFSESQHLCLPDTIYWHNQIITAGGTYYDSLTTKIYGFDSIYVLTVDEHQSYSINERIEIVEGYTTHIHGINISQPGLYHDTLFTAYGCDSIYHIQVNTKRTLEQTQFIKMCQGDTLDFYNQKLTRSGTYIHTSAHGDTTITLKLTVNPITIVEKLVVVEEDELPYIYEGAEYWKDTLYIIDEGTNQHGCDSILRMTLAIAKYVSEWDQMPLCPGSEIRIDDQVITKPGQYTFIRRSVQSGKRDSLYRVEVYAAPAYDLQLEPRTICYGDTVFCAGKAITRAGHYDFSLKTKEGCDSLLHLDVTVNPSYQFDTTVYIVDYETYTWPQDNRTYNKTGDYERTWQTMLDCDSTYVLHLSVDSTIRNHTNDTICIGQSYSWRGKTYDVDGYYVDTVRIPAAHFSAIYTLRLVVAYPTYITNARTGDICADSEGFDIEFEYSGYRPSSYSIYFDALAKREGFKDIHNAPLRDENIAHVELPSFSSICYNGHPYYVRPDYYSMRLVLDNGVCGLSRSDSIILLVKYPSWIIEQNWNDVVAPLKPEYNGGFEFAQTDWYVNDVYQPNTNGYLHSDALHTGDKVVMKAVRKGENYAIPTCPLTIEAPAPNTYEYPILVYPTQSPRQMPVITIETSKDGKYDVYSSTGILITSGEVVDGTTQVTLPMMSGIYFFRITQGEKAETHKVILY